MTQHDLRELEAIVSLGFENSARGLSAMIDKQIGVVSPRLRLVPTMAIPPLLGQPDEEVVAVYLSVSGDANAHVLLILSIPAANELLAMLMGDSSGVPFDDVSRSALGEVGNVMGAFFLNALGDKTALLLHPSTPSVMTDMAGAVMEIPLLALALSAEDVLLIDTLFVDDSHKITALLLIVPDADSLSLIVDRLNVACHA